MAEFVKAGPVIIDLLVEGRLRRHQDEIAARHIERALTADTEIRPGRHDQGLGVRDQFAFRQGL